MPVTENVSTDVQKYERSQKNKMEAYYSFQSKIYDATRWSFLFGRKKIINLLPGLDAESTLIEVGCGTGYNLQYLASKYQHTNILGLDISKIMLTKATKKVQNKSNIRLINQAYGTSEEASEIPSKVNLILFSYALSMINPHWSSLIDQAKKDLKPGGFIAVVDFEDSRFPWFKKHMGNNHVRMDSHIIPYLNQSFQAIESTSRKAYAGVWTYFTYIGQLK